jgi:hypothetical protein
MISGYRAPVIALMFVALAGCRAQSGPEKAMYSYVRAVNEGRCDDAFNLLSERTRHALDVLRTRPLRPQEPVPIENYFCRPLMFEDCKWKQMTLSFQQGDTASVSMRCGSTQDSFLPGFSSVFLKYEPRLTELVREGDEWRRVDPVLIRILKIFETEDRAIEAEMRERARFQRERELK